MSIAFFSNMYCGPRPPVAASGRFSPQHVRGLKIIESTHPVAASGCFSRVAASGRFCRVAASGCFCRVAASGRFCRVAASGRKWPLFPFSISTPNATAVILRCWSYLTQGLIVSLVLFCCPPYPNRNWK